MTEREREARRLRLFLARLEREQEAVASVYDRLTLAAAERVFAALPEALAPLQATVRAAIQECERGD